MTKHDYRGAMTGGSAEHQALWLKICDEHDKLEAAFVEWLRARGVKMAHPNDGWIDRENNIARPSYPHFDDGAEVGDLVCFGWHDTKPEKLIWGRITSKRTWLNNHPEYHFERTTCPDNPVAKKD